MPDTDHPENAPSEDPFDEIDREILDGMVARGLMSVDKYEFSSIEVQCSECGKTVTAHINVASRYVSNWVKSQIVLEHEEHHG